MTAIAARRTLDDTSASAPGAITDATLIAGCRAGDAAAERALYERHVGAAFRAAFRLCGDSDLAADITQEAFVAAFARLEQFQGRSAFRTWLIAIVASSARIIAKRGRWLRHRTAPLDDQIPARSAPDHGSDLTAHLERAIGRLSEKLRVVFVMHDVEGFTHEEIAATLTIPVGTSKARLFDARAKLRGALASHWKDRLL